MTTVQVITGATVDVDGTDVTVTVQTGQPGVGLPAGGSTGQVLAKASGAAYDYAWTTAGGSVTSVTAGTGLTGGTITGSGTIAADFGTAAGKVCEGNDARLSDARTPTSHTHTQSEVTGLLTALSAKVPQTRLVNTGNGITGGGDLTGNLQLDLDYAASGTSSSTKPVRADDSRLSDSRAPNGSAGGDMTGTYPNPTIGNAKVTTAKIDDGAVTLAKVVAPTAGSKLLGSSNPDTGAFKEISIGTGLSMSGSTLSSTSSGATPSVDDFTGSGTYTVPSGATWLLITCIGGGGGGGAGYQAAAGNLRAGGGGGGGGAITILRYAVADLSGNYGLTITVGGAGGGGSGSGSGLGNNGTGGGASSVSITATSKQIAYAQGGTAANRGSATAGGSGGGAATVGTFSAGSGATGGTTAQVGAPGAPAMGAPGGGGGGGVTDTNGGFAGGNGRPGSASTDGTSNSGGGASGATGTNGSTVGTSIGAVVGGSGSGGGGGTTNAGGNGGAGNRGGGGGGGGGGTTAGGSGGSGGAGFVRIEVI